MSTPITLKVIAGYEADADFSPASHFRRRGTSYEVTSELAATSKGASGESRQRTKAA